MIVADLITGGAVSSFTVLVTVVVFPALSFATMVIVLLPSFSVTSLLKVPLGVTGMGAPFTVTVTGLLVASSVVPLTVTVDLFVINPSAGAEIDNVGGIVSTVNVTDFCAAAFPS